MKTNRLIGGILLVSGTTIGGGMLALPVVTGIYGLPSSVITLTAVWFINVLIALALLEVNLRSPQDSNLITMARTTLGPIGEAIAWASCLLFLYAILVAYCSGLHELINDGVKEIFNITISSWLDVTLIVTVFGLFIYAGTRVCDYVNRLFISCLGVSFILLLYHILPFIRFDNFAIEVQNPMLALPIVFTSFGYLIVIPSIRSYLNSDVAKIRLSILMGSFIPLVLYLIWVTAIVGVVPVTGSNGLKQILLSGDPGTGISHAITALTSHHLLSNLVKVFVFCAISTSFIGVSLGLHDFLSDGLNICQKGRGNVILTLLTFFPPLMFTLLFQKLFLAALGYAALFSVIIFGAYPALMAWSGRRGVTKDVYRLFGNRMTLLFILLFSLLVFIIETLKITHLI